MDYRYETKDDTLINEAMEKLNELSSILNIEEFGIYFGFIPENNFAPDYYYGKYANGNITKEIIR